jgi:hypothetical protein
MMNNIEDIKKALELARLACTELEALLVEKNTKAVKLWEPAGGLWFIDADGVVDSGPPDIEFSRFGAERPTKELAERASAEMRKFNRLLAYRDEVCPDYEPDWTTESPKFFVLYNHQTLNWVVSTRGYLQVIGEVYFTEQAARDLVDKLNSGEVVL